MGSEVPKRPGKKMAKVAQKLTGFATRAPVILNNGLTWYKPKFNIFMKYARVELRPPSGSDFGEVGKGIKQIPHSYKSGAYKELYSHKHWSMLVYVWKLPAGFSSERSLERDPW